MSPISRPRPDLFRRCRGLLAFVWLAGAIAGVLVYPLPVPLLAGALLLYGAVLWWRPTLWLLIVPALLPVLDLAPWTGWFFLEEVDLLLLVTLAVCSWRVAPQRSATLPSAIGWLLALFACAWLIGMGHGMGLGPALQGGKWPSIDSNSFASYFSPFNSLRIAKSLFWLVALVPLLLRSAGPELVNLRRLFVPGMLTGLALVCAAALWERIQFPGLMNFASDYRITAPFSAMHTGGAALDGYLTLATPFVALWLARAGWRQPLAALVLLSAAIFIGLATFSRGVYLAYGGGALLFMLFFALQARRQEVLSRRATVSAALLLAAVAFVLHHVFVTSGYRGLGAGLALLAAAAFLSGLSDRAALVPLHWQQPGRRAWTHLLPALAIGLAMSAIGAVLANVAVVDSKAAYVLFGLSMLVCGVGGVLRLIGTAGRGPFAARAVRRLGTTLAAAGLLWMSCNAILVAQHWGGRPGLVDMLPLAGIALLLVPLNRLPTEPLWLPRPGNLRIALACGVMLALAIPLSGSYYTGSRFATVGADLDVRLDHWREALDMMTPGPAATVFGMGLGRYPETYFWKNESGEVPSTYRFAEEQRNGYLRLAAPQYRRGYGEVVRILQQVAPRPHTPYLIGMDIRHADKNAGVRFAVCERWLLYPQNCAEKYLPEAAADNQWHHVEVAIDSGTLGSSSAFGPKPVRLQLSVYGSKTVVDVDNVSMIDRTNGAELVRNGAFSHANDGWFFSSDHYHLPWHIKNLLLNIYFETGLFGSIAFLSLVLAMSFHLVRGMLAGRLEAAVSLTSLSGFLLVGLFDSLLDVPRLALLFFLVAIASVLQARQDAPGRRRTPRHVSRDALPEQPHAVRHTRLPASAQL